jgi:hypothetical protein
MLAANADSTFTLHIAGQSVSLGRSAAHRVWVSPL